MEFAFQASENRKGRIAAIEAEIIKADAEFNISKFEKEAKQEEGLGTIFGQLFMPGITDWVTGWDIWGGSTSP